MSNFKRISLSILALTWAALACVSPSVTITPDANAISTYIAQTLTLAAALTSAAAPAASATPTVTFTPEPPTPTPTASLTATPIFTFTPLVPVISVSISTNCRRGPGKIYDMEGALLVGESAEVLGKDPTAMYWYIRNPDSTGDFCWVWGEYATISGNTAALPIYTPPPTPTPSPTATPAPDFALDYEDMKQCSNAWWVDLSLKNTGSFTFKSMILRVTDKNTDIETTTYLEDFTVRESCTSSTTRDVLAPGRIFLISSPDFDYNPEGHTVRARVTLCTEEAQGGSCVMKSINFKP